MFFFLLISWPSCDRERGELPRSRKSKRHGARGCAESYLNGSGALCAATSESIHFWNSSGVWTVTNPRIR